MSRRSRPRRRSARMSPLSRLFSHGRTVERALDFKRGRQLRVESLETRAMLSVTLSGVPDWTAEGPGPILNGQVENVPSPSVLGDDPVSGAIHTVLVDPGNADVMYAGTTNGGIWKTTNGTSAAGPTWTPLTDQFASLSISALEFDPTDPTNNTIVAGFGAYSSFTGRPSGPLNGLLRTTDGGTTWEEVGNSTRATAGTPGGLQGVSVSGLAMRGNNIFVSASNRGAGAGVYFSNDGGTTFNFVSGTNGLPNVGQPLDLVADPGNVNRLYVAIGSSANGGVWRTDNANVASPTWNNATDANLAGALSGSANNFELAVSAAGTNPVYAGIITNGQLTAMFRSGNQGAAWAPMDIPLVLAGNTAIPVGNMTGAVAGPIVITSPGHGLSQGENPQVRITGSTGNTAANGDFFVTLVDPDGGGPLTMADGFSLDGSTGNGAYTGGAVWSAITGIQPREKPGTQGNTHFSIAADPTNANLVYVGGDRQDTTNNPLGATTSSGNLWRGDFSIAPGGPNAAPSPQWTPLTHTGTNSASSPHADSRDIRFRPNGDLVEVDDGGIYLRTNPQTSNGDWFSLHGNIQNTEFHDIAYDSNSNIIIGGAQDVGTPQQTSSGSTTWTSVSVADGGDVAVDNIALAGAGQSIRYSSTQNFNSARRRTYDAAGNFVAGSDVTLALNLVGAGTAITQGAAGNVQFVTPLATNDVVGSRLVIGGGANLWESTDLGANVSELFATGNASLGVNRNAIAAGGMSGGAANPDALYVGSGSQVFVRSTAGGLLAATNPPGAGNIIDVAMDPTDWMTAYAIDVNSVFMTTDGGAQWDDITGDLVDANLRSVVSVASAGMSAVLVGGVTGVSKAVSTALGTWTEFGAGLPNALVWDMDYDLTDDTLVVGTMGRGAWSVDNVEAAVFDDGILDICGDEDHVNQDDEIRLVRNGANPLLLDVYINSATPVFTTPLALINQINVFGVGGNDTLIVDSSNGLINVPDGIRYDGDGVCPGDVPQPGYDRGIDTLELRQTDGDEQVSSTVTVGATVGQGISTIVGVGIGNTQTVYFEELEPIVDNVPAASFTVDGAMIGSLLHAANHITYDDSDLFPGNWARITIDAFEPIHVTAKQTIAIDAENGDDVVVLNKAQAPTDLTNLIVRADNGNDTVLVQNVPDDVGGFVDVQVFGGAGDDVLDGRAVATTTPLILQGEAGNDMLTGGAGADVLNGGDGDDTLVDSPLADTFVGGDGNDEIVIRGTLGGDLIDVMQLAPSAVLGSDYQLSVTNAPLTGPFSTVTDLIVSINLGLAPSNAANRPSVELIRIEALAGDDVLRAGHADAYGDTDGANGIAAQTIAMYMQGDSPNASDRLAVRDDGLGDLVIHRLGADQRSGSFTVGGMAPIDYDGVEFAEVLPLDPITGGTGTDGLGRLVVFKNDPYETNNSLATAWFLGAGAALNVDPTIDPAGFDFPPFGPDPFDIPGDNDFFRFVAQETGTLDIQVYFDPIATLANGRAGLPGDGELTITVLDANGNPATGVGSGADIIDDNDTAAAGDDVKIGERIAVPVVRNRTYYVRIEGETADAINVYNFTAINTAAPIPQAVDLQAASDSGRHDGDDVTKIVDATFDIILDDDRLDEFANRDLIPDTVNDDQPTETNGAGTRIDYGVEVFNNAVSIGYAFYTGAGNTWQFTATAGDLNEGDNNLISAAVWIRDASEPLATATISRHELSVPLQVTLDTITPPVAFGLPDAASQIDGLAADSDSGVITTPATFADRVTSDTTPRLWGRAEANSIIRVYHDDDADGVIDLLTDTFLGQTVALPFDGNDVYPDGYWELVTAVDLNEIAPLPKDGVRRLLVTGEDLAGNPMPMADEIADGVDELYIFIDTQGPQLTDATVNDLTSAEYDLFDPKPTETGPTPLVHSITLAVQDLPNRFDGVGVLNDFLYEALKADVAAAPGNYLVVGDHVGVIPIETVTVTNDPRTANNPATATITLDFFTALPDDRYTLTVRDSLVDPANNRLDGESNAIEPQETPLFPTGDGVPGGDFVGRFTIDSRPEIGVYIPQQINLDINGNQTWDPGNQPTGGDDVNVDLTFTMQVANPATGAHDPGGFGVHDLVFAGKFGAGGGLLVGDNAVFVIDVSGSTSNAFGGDPVGDLNGDGFSDTILDAEIAAFKLLTQQLVDRGLGNTAQVGIAAFETSSTILDMDPVAAGVQLTTTPLADANANGMRDIDEALMQLLDLNTTNFEAGLQDAISIITGAGLAAGSANVIFLSDGLPNAGGSFTDEVATIATALGHNLRAFGVGPGASLPSLQTIDPAAVTFTNTNELLAAFGGAAGGVGGGANGFDTLAVYGHAQDLASFRWLIDRNSDGVVNTGEGDILTLQPLQTGFDILGAIPVAGNFDGNAANGDEIGLYNLGTWVLDRDRDFVIETNGDDTIINGTLFGHPIVGDFDRDGLDDLGVFNNNTWHFDMAADGLGVTNVNGFGADAAGTDRDDTLIWGFPGVLDRPVAADMDQDGVDDIGLWVPRDNAQIPETQAEWYFLLSNQFDANRVPTVGAVSVGTIDALDHPYEPAPFGFDLYAEFGNDRALPIVGNFDPPVTAGSDSAPLATPADAMPGDFTSDGMVTGGDFLAWQRGYGKVDAAVGSGDADGDQQVTGSDLSIWAEHFGDGMVAAVATVPGDFAADGAVNGGDFLAWQRGYGATTNAADLQEWQSEFGSGATVASAAAATGGSTGDFDGDATITGGDFLLWQRQAGQTVAIPGAGADANGDGVVDAADLAAWQAGFGSSTILQTVIAAQQSSVSTQLAAGAASVNDAATGGASAGQVDDLFAAGDFTGLFERPARRAKRVAWDEASADSLAGYRATRREQADSEATVDDALAEWQADRREGWTPVRRETGRPAGVARDLAAALAGLDDDLA